MKMDTLLSSLLETFEKNRPRFPVNVFAADELFATLGSRQKINGQDGAVFWFVYKAHPPVHISGYVLVDATQ